MTLNLPMRLGPDGALLDAAGRPLTPDALGVLARIANAAWRLALAEQGSVLAWRARHADFLGAVGAAGEKRNRNEH